MKFLNLGCGRRYHPDWINIDFQSHSDIVIAHNLLQGIPAKSNTYDLVYHSHLLEHVSKDHAPKFLEECRRVLKPDGVLRVVVPDLEDIVQQYMASLEQALDGKPGWDTNYDWMMLELFDQTVRQSSGGAMADYLKQESIPNADFVIQRLGVEASRLMGAKTSNINRHPTGPSPSGVKQWVETWVKPVYRFLRYSTYRRETMLKTLLGQEYETLKLGRFRQRGEVHQWMYDRYSLKRLLERCGFEDIVQRTATESYIADWASFNLDTEPDGSIYKPDSLFMEARNPPA